MSSIIFHCIICFDSFDCNETYPVVLPCGHTYICNECASRIDKCYECRENLFYYLIDESKTSSSQPSQQQLQSRNVPGSSYNTRPSQSISAYNRRGPTVTNQQAIKKIKKRLPLPKNLVLMSLIESNANTSNAQKEVAKLLTGKEIKVEHDDDFDVELLLFLETQICGTYMCTNRNGLAVYQHKPKHNQVEEDSINMYEEEHLNIPGNKLTRINFGDHVQIVSIEDGWAIVARQNGYINAHESNLIRVGGPRDKACHAEGMLYNLFVHWKSIEKKYNKILSLKNELILEFKQEMRNTNDELVVQPATESELEILEAKKQKEEKLEERIREEQKRKEMKLLEELREPESIKEMHHKENLRKHDKVHPNMRTGRSGHCALLSSKAHSTSKKKFEYNQHSMHHIDPLHKISTHTALTMPKTHD